MKDEELTVHEKILYWVDKACSEAFYQEMKTEDVTVISLRGSGSVGLFILDTNLGSFEIEVKKEASKMKEFELAGAGKFYDYRDESVLEVPRNDPLIGEMSVKMTESELLQNLSMAIERQHLLGEAIQNMRKILGMTGV